MRISAKEKCKGRFVTRVYARGGCQAPFNLENDEIQLIK